MTKKKKDEDEVRLPSVPPPDIMLDFSSLVKTLTVNFTPPQPKYVVVVPVTLPPWLGSEVRWVDKVVYSDEEVLKIMADHPDAMVLGPSKVEP